MNVEWYGPEEVFDQMKKDAERWRWIKQQHESQTSGWHVRNNYTGLATNNIPDDLNAEVDAAMSIPPTKQQADAK